MLLGGSKDLLEGDGGRKRGKFRKALFSEPWVKKRVYYLTGEKDVCSKSGVPQLDAQNQGVWVKIQPREGGRGVGGGIPSSKEKDISSATALGVEPKGPFQCPPDPHKK